MYMYDIVKSNFNDNYNDNYDDKHENNKNDNSNNDNNVTIISLEAIYNRRGPS